MSQIDHSDVKTAERLYTQLFIPYRERYETYKSQVLGLDPFDSRFYSFRDSRISETCIPLLEEVFPNAASSGHSADLQKAHSRYRELRGCLNSLRYRRAGVPASELVMDTLDSCRVQLDTLYRIALVSIRPRARELTSVCRRVASDLECGIRAKQQSLRGISNPQVEVSNELTRLTSLNRLAHDYFTFAGEDSVGDFREDRTIVEYWGKEARAVLSQHASAIASFATDFHAAVPGQEEVGAATIVASGSSDSYRPVQEVQEATSETESWKLLFEGLATVADMLDNARSDKMQAAAELVGEVSWLQGDN